MTKAEINWLYLTGHMKDQVLGNVFGGTFSDFLRQSRSPHLHCQDIWLSTSCQIWNFLLSCWSCLLSSGLKFVFLTKNLTFLEIIVKPKLPAKFCLHSFEWFCLQISSDPKVFLSCRRLCDQGLIVVILYYFQIWNKKENDIIICRVISSHMGPIYIETPNIDAV